MYDMLQNTLHSLNQLRWQEFIISVQYANSS